MYSASDQEMPGDGFDATRIVVKVYPTIGKLVQKFGLARMIYFLLGIGPIDTALAPIQASGLQERLHEPFERQSAGAA